MKRTLMMTAAFAFAAQMAAALTADELAASLTADGYSYIQIKTGTTQIKSQAIKDGQKVETIYDAATGTVLKTETYAVGTIASSDPGVVIRDVPRDFVRLNADGTVAEGYEHAKGPGHGRGRGRDDSESASAGGVVDDGSHHGRGRDDSDDDSSDDGSDDHGDDHGGGHGGGNGGGGRGRG